MKPSRVKKAKTAKYDNSRTDEQQRLDIAFTDWQKKEAED